MFIKMIIYTLKRFKLRYHIIDYELIIGSKMIDFLYLVARLSRAIELVRVACVKSAEGRKVDKERN